MGSLELPLFLFATFADALVADLTGFAFGLVAASTWFCILTPLQTAMLTIAFGLIVQGYAVATFRRLLLASGIALVVEDARLFRPISWNKPSYLLFCCGILRAF